MDEVKSRIASIIRGQVRGGGVLLWRGEAEREFLARYASPSTADSPPADGHGGTAEEVISVSEMIRSCAKCLATGERKPPFGGGGNGVMVMLNPPAMMGRAERTAYRKESAELLRKMCAAIALDIEECYVTGTIKCEPAGAAISPGAMLAQCEHILEREILEQGPRIILVMGDILPLKRIKDRHASARWFAVEHPIALIKNPDLKKRAWTTLKLVRQALDDAPGRS